MGPKPRCVHKISNVFAWYIIKLRGFLPGVLFFSFHFECSALKTNIFIFVFWTKENCRNFISEAAHKSRHEIKEFLMTGVAKFKTQENIV